MPQWSPCNTNTRMLYKSPLLHCRETTPPLKPHFSLTCDTWEYVWCHNVPHAIQTPEQVSFITLQRAGSPLSIKTTFFTLNCQGVYPHMFTLSHVWWHNGPHYKHMNALQVLFITLQKTTPRLKPHFSLAHVIRVLTQGFFLYMYQFYHGKFPF